MTAATVVGPAHAPRPTSSIPHTRRSPDFQHRRSKRNVGEVTVTFATYSGVTCARRYHRRVQPGTRVEVRSRFDQRWARGFEIEEKVDDQAGPCYRLRRRSDGSVLPALFIDDDVREEKRKSMWWV